MRVAEYAFGILHDLSGFVPQPALRNNVILSFRDGIIFIELSNPCQ